MAADGDLVSIQEARDAMRRSAQAQAAWKRADQAKVDRVCEAVVAVFEREADRLGRLAFDESGFGDPASKARKNRFAARSVWESVRTLRTCGVIAADEVNRVYEIAEPYGVVLGIVPVTNPTSTAIFKVVIALKTRNSIVLSPHPRAVQCIGEVARLAADAATRAGAPKDLVLCLAHPTFEGTDAAMKARETALILATGGPGLVKAAYSSGKPAIGVGPGNAPVYIEKSADVALAVEAIVQSQVFDNGTLCCSEQAVVVDAPIKDAVVAGFKALGAHFCSAEEKTKLARIVANGRSINPAIVGLYPWQIGERAGFKVARDCPVLLADEDGVGWDHPLSMEKLSPILAFYVVKDWKEGCERCIEILDFGGRGHTLTIHSRDEKIIWEFALEKPTHRILVNTPASHGAIGYSTGLKPSLTLGCGAFGGNITSDNITAEHLLLKKRLAFGKPGFIEEEARRRKERGTLLPASLPKRLAPPSFHGSGGGSGAGLGGIGRGWPTPPRKRV
ncbi:MAG: aldehyde dehydrogenase family protein [Planctomycetes bacterium]|nr:aldehyde dehydrogenase family protein [Planctomycetota bacterium]